MPDDPQARGRAAIVDRLRWIDGHADVWRLFDDADALAAVVDALAAPWTSAGVTKVCGVEARGLLLGGAVAVRLGVGFVAVRKGDALFPGPKRRVVSEPDYRGRVWDLALQAHSLGPDDRVVLVDDWAERGTQARAARELVEASGATYLGLSVIVDQLDPDARARLDPVVAIMTADELPTA